MDDDGDVRIDGLDRLEVPDPRVGFWEELRSAIEADGSVDGSRATDLPPTPPPRAGRPRWRLVAAVAAVGLIALTAALHTTADRDDDTSIRQSTETSGTPVAAFTVFDLDRLPASWQVDGPTGNGRFVRDRDPTNYQWTARIGTAEGVTVTLSAQAPLAIGTAGATFVTVQGQPGSVREGTLAWFDPTSGAGLSLSTDDLTDAELLALAEQIPVTTVDGSQE